MTFERTITEDDLDAASAEFVRGLRQDAQERDAAFEVADVEDDENAALGGLFTG